RRRRGALPLLRTRDSARRGSARRNVTTGGRNRRDDRARRRRGGGAAARNGRDRRVPAILRGGRNLFAQGRGSGRGRTFMTAPIASRLFSLDPDIRYVAVNHGGSICEMEQRAGHPTLNPHETDRMEELIVNPIVLEAVRRRGNLDLDGVRHVVI